MSIIEAFAGFRICLFHYVFYRTLAKFVIVVSTVFTLLLLTMVFRFPLRFGQICQNLKASLSSSIASRVFCPQITCAVSASQSARYMKTFIIIILISRTIFSLLKHLGPNNNSRACLFLTNLIVGQ